MSYKYYNANPLNNKSDDCTIRAISTALNMSWDSVYDMLSDLAQEYGTMQDNRNFILDFLNSNFERMPTYGMTVGDVARKYDNNIVLITMLGHITTSKYGKLYDTFDCRNRKAEYVWIVE